MILVLLLSLRRDLSMRTIIAFLIGIAIVAANCCLTGCMCVGERMDCAEALLESQPDSAMMLLNEFTVDDIFFDDDKARYALLYSQAQDKNYIDETSDSLIRIAVDQYNIDGTPMQQFLSLYYWGRIQYNAGNYYTALATFSRAEQLAPYIDNHRALGLLYSQMGDIYFQHFDYPKSLQAFKAAYFHYDKADLPQHQNYALIDQGYSYVGIGSRDSSGILFKNALNNAIEREDSLQVFASSMALFSRYIKDKEVEKALELYNQYQNYFFFNYANSALFTDIALLHAYNNDSVRYNKYMSEAKLNSRSRKDSVYLYLAEALYFEHNKDFATAYKKLNQKVDLDNSLALKALEQPVITAQRDFLSSELALKKREHRRDRTLYIVSTLLFIAISAIVFLLLYRRYRRNRELLNEYAEIVAELQDSLQSQQGKTELIQELFSNKYSLVNNLGGLLADFEDSKQAGKQMVNEVKSMIEKLGKDKALRDLNALIDKYCDNAMTLLHQEMPHLSLVEYKQISYHYAGFSVKLIGLFMNENTVNIYKRRDRIKDKINVSAPQHKEFFLSLFR